MTDMEMLITILKTWTVVSCPVVTVLGGLKPINSYGVFYKILLLPAFIVIWTIDIIVEDTFKGLNKE